MGSLGVKLTAENAEEDRKIGKLGGDFHSLFSVFVLIKVCNGLLRAILADRNKCDGNYSQAVAGREP